MKRVTIAIDPYVDLKFRKKASQKYQFEKGWYSNAVAEAMLLWAEDSNIKDTEEKNNDFLTNFNTVMNQINPKMWDKVKLKFGLTDENMLENVENIINNVNPENSHQVGIERKEGNIVIELNNKYDSDVETNLESFMLFPLIIKVLIFSLEETSKEKFEIVGFGKMPPAYIKKIKN